MGVRFGLESTSIVAYLTARDEHPPRVTVETMLGFLQTLAQDHDVVRPRLISSSPEWVRDLKRRAADSLERLYALPYAKDHVLEPELVRSLLGPVAEALGVYDIYVLPVGTWRDSDVLDRFAEQAARLPGHGILVLIPDYYDADRNVTVLDPGAGTAEALKQPHLWPGAIFLLRNGVSRFVPLDDALGKLFELNDVIQTYGDAHDEEVRLRRAADVLTAYRAPVPTGLHRLVHLSDLHLGTDRARQTQTLLQLALREEVRSADRVVITGDLFDQPRRRHAQDFTNFRDQLRMICGTNPIVIPGNHDQRLFGNALFGVGRRLRHLVELQWQKVIVDEAANMVFLCFDSARSGEFARGEIGVDQLLRVATEYELANKNDRLAGYLKVALLHHHPYPYGSRREVTVLDPGSWISLPDLLAMKDASQFLTWCAGRDVSLVLHGHKHLPRLVRDHVEIDNGTTSYHPLSTVACGSSLGAHGSPLSFNIVEWNAVDSTWSVDFKIDRGDGQGFRSVTLGTGAQSTV